MKKYVQAAYLGYTDDFKDYWDNGKLGFVDYIKAEAKNRYEEYSTDISNVLCGLNNCDGAYGIGYVSYHEDYGLDINGLKNLCSGYIFGDEHLKQNILDFLEDINFHIECAELESEPEKFTTAVLLNMWEY